MDVYARKELNQQLYERKMDGEMLPHYSQAYRAYQSVISGETDKTFRSAQNEELPLQKPQRLLSENIVTNLRYHFIIEATTIARLCMESGLSHDEAHTLSDIYIRKLDSLESPAGIVQLYQLMCIDFAERMGEIRKACAVSRHIRKCIQYIYENLGADLSMKVFTEITGLSSGYLSRLFAKETGQPLKQFILSAKIDTAKNLLKNSDVSYSRIAASLGFCSQSAFIAAFKRSAGITPKAYRDRQHV